MATTPKALYRGAAATSSATLYTVPASTTAVVTNIVVSGTGTAGTFTLALDGVEIASGTAVAANGQWVADIKQPLAATKTITGFASATSIKFHVAGVEIV